MKRYVSRHPELASIVALFAAVALLGGLTHGPSRSQDVPTPDATSTPALTFRNIDPPAELPPAGPNVRLPLPNATATPVVREIVDSSGAPRTADGDKIEVIPFGDTQMLRDEIAEAATEIIYLMPNEANTPFMVDDPISITHSVVIYGNNAQIIGVGTDREEPLIQIGSAFRIVDVELHHLSITSALNNGQGGYGYGGAIGIGQGEIVSIFDSEIAYNTAAIGGGGIMNGGALYLERVAIHNNFAGGGAGIQNDHGGSITAICSKFVGNSGRYAAGILNGDQANGAGWVSVHDSVFDQNHVTPSAFADIDTVARATPTLMAAEQNWWGIDNNMPSVGTSVDTTPKLNDDPLAAPYTLYPRCKPRLPRLVSEEAVPFHVYGEEYGIPAPFTRLPYNVNQLGQEYVTVNGVSTRAHDPLGWFRETELPAQITLRSQGFGPTLTAYGYRRLYRYVFGIHSGIDYGDGDIWQERAIVSLCDGIVIEGNNVTGTERTGGSASPGRGVSVRCFMEPIDFSVGEIIDFQPALSNIVVTYNHFIDSTVVPCSFVPHVSDCETNFTLPVAGDVIRVGDILGQTGGDPDLDHLHLTVHLARGFSRELNVYSDNSFHLNPLIMYETRVVKQHEFQGYYGDAPNEGFNIPRGDLSEWSAGGFNSGPFGEIEANSFWNVQNKQQAGAEWPPDYFTFYVNHELTTYLEQSYSTNSYDAPLCNLSIDVGRAPDRLIGDCADESDLYDETPYSHPPTPTP